MDCSIFKDHKHTVAYGTNCCVRDTTWELLIQNTCLEPKMFHFIVQVGGTYAVMERDSLGNTLHNLTSSHVAYGAHTWQHPVF